MNTQYSEESHIARAINLVSCSSPGNCGATSEAGGGRATLSKKGLARLKGGISLRQSPRGMCQETLIF